MTGRILGSTCAAAMLAATVTAAQGQAPASDNPQQRPAGRTEQTAARPQGNQQVTLVGCMAREGASDLILTGAMPTATSGSVAGGVTGSTPTAGTSGAGAGAATGTAGAATGMRYRLSGERDLDQYVGQRVEIVGRTDSAAGAMAPNASGASAGIGSTTSAPSPGTPSTGSASAGATTGPSAASGAGETSGGAAGAGATGGGSAAGAISDSSRSGTISSGNTGASAPGSTTGATGSATGAGARSGNTAQTTAMPHITITSVRALGGSCI